MKLLSHFEHWNGFSPVCVISCLIKLLDNEKIMSHFEHWNGFSPVWRVLLCFIKALEEEKFFLHGVQVYCLSPAEVPDILV